MSGTLAFPRRRMRRRRTPRPLHWTARHDTAGCAHDTIEDAPHGVQGCTCARSDQASAA